MQLKAQADTARERPERNPSSSPELGESTLTAGVKRHNSLTPATGQSFPYSVDSLAELARGLGEHSPALREAVGPHVERLARECS